MREKNEHKNFSKMNSSWENWNMKVKTKQLPYNDWVTIGFGKK